MTNQVKSFRHSVIFPDWIKIVSVNEQYSPRYSRRGKLIGFYRNPEVINMMNHIKNSLSESKIPNSLITDDWGYLEVGVVIIMKQSFNRRDLDNTLKHSLDAVFQYFNVNDSRVISINSRKYENTDINNEAMLISIEPLGWDPNNYKLDNAVQLMENTNEQNSEI